MDRPTQQTAILKRRSLRQTKRPPGQTGAKLLSAIPFLQAAFVEKIGVLIFEFQPLLSAASRAPFVDHRQERDGDRLVINLWPARFCRQQLQASRKSIHGIAEGITTQHFVAETDVFRMRKSGKIESA